MSDHQPKWSNEKKKITCLLKSNVRDCISVVGSIAGCDTREFQGGIQPINYSTYQRNKKKIR